MSERGKRVVRVLLDRERDADVVERIEQQGSITGYLRTLVRRDIHDERIDYAAMKAAELQAENAKLRELVRESVRFERYGCYGCSREDTCGAQGIYDEECVRRQGIEQSMRELGVEVDG